jgi:hypothetical protein
MAGTGLQPLNIFLIIFPFIVSATIVTIRIWTKVKDRQLAIGMVPSHPSQVDCMLTRLVLRGYTTGYRHGVFNSSHWDYLET